MRSSFVLLMTVALTSCSTLWNAANREGLEADIAQLFQAQADVEVRPSCNMVGTSRTGACLMSASTREVASLVRGLGLLAVRSDEDFTVIAPWEAEGGCRNLGPFGNESSASVYRSTRAVDNLQTGSGTSFEYILLYHKPETGQLCVQASYDFG